MKRCPWFALLALCAPCALGACDSNEEAASAVHAPMAFDVEECASCGMIVRDQPAPRAQVVHSSGAVRYFCSIADLVTYLEAPSPEGQVVATFVETMDPEADLAVNDKAVRPWVRADSAAFLLGVARSRVMGVPVLAYGGRAAAEQGRQRHGGELHTWETLVAALSRARP